MLNFVLSYLKPAISFVLSLVLSVTTLFGTYENDLVPEDYNNGNIKNVVFLIGDGMGPLHLEKTKHDLGIELTMDTFPYQGRSQTRSLTDEVTDSAAGGTALAAGIRTYNSAVGVYMHDPLHVMYKPMNLSELCKANGMMTGIVTTDSTAGATPGAFSVHTYSRYNTEDIDKQQLNSNLDLIWGGSSDTITREKAEAKGFTFVQTYSEMMAVEEGTRSFAQFDNATWKLEQVNAETPTLEQMAMKAIDILDDTDEGFFLMVEGAHIDKNSHSNDEKGMVEALAEFDKTIKSVLEYAEADGETLVVITADHETGGIILNADGSYSFTKGSHSSANVPVLVYGSESFIENGEVLKNYEIPIRVAYTLGFDKAAFPCTTVAAWAK